MGSTLHVEVYTRSLMAYVMEAKASLVWWVITDPKFSIVDFVIALLNLGILLNKASVITSNKLDLPEPVGPVIAKIPALLSGSFSNEIYQILR